MTTCAIFFHCFKFVLFNLLKPLVIHHFKAFLLHYEHVPFATGLFQLCSQGGSTGHLHVNTVPAMYILVTVYRFIRVCWYTTKLQCSVAMFRSYGVDRIFEVHTEQSSCCQLYVLLYYIGTKLDFLFYFILLTIQ